ncbi:MAG: alpha/beta hydrolase [Acidimicrobiia bacterium]|nr:alpha/beta hydrolase [Acidimicrobiia bacterium]
MSRHRFVSAQAAVLDKWGVAAESRFVEVPKADGPTHVLVAGSGPPLVMLGGAGTPAAMFAPLMAHLIGYRMYAVDHPGHGLSGRQRGYGDDLARNSVRHITGVLGQLKVGRASFLATSFGSRVAFWFADSNSDRVSSAIHIGCPAVALNTSAPLPMRLMATRLAKTINRIAAPSESQVRQLSKMVNEHPLAPQITELLIATELQEGFACAHHEVLRALVRVRGARPAMALTEEQLRSVRYPVQIIWGTNDPFGTPDVGRRIAAAIPNAEIHIVSGGHAPWLRSGAEVGSHASAFLANTPYP